MADLITLRLTFDELTSMMHVLETAKDDARQAVLRAEHPNPVYRPLHPDTARQVRKAARDTLERVTGLCDMVTDIWRENHPSAAE